jgi:hypothetical protein
LQNWQVTAAGAIAKEVAVTHERNANDNEGMVLVFQHRFKAGNLCLDIFQFVFIFSFLFEMR